MRVKKQKRNRRTVKFFSACFGFREPFKVICDGTFVHHLLLHRLLPADDALSKLLGARVTLFSSRCITAELKSLGESHLESLEASLQLISASCDHEKRVNAAACIESIVAEGNDKHFFVATQDVELRRKLREVPSVPVIYGLKNSLLVEQPSTTQREFVKHAEEKRLHATISEVHALKSTRANDGHQGQDPSDQDQAARPRIVKRKLDSTEKSKFKRKRAKGPNPLSCKKKKSKEVPVIKPSQEGAPATKKRKRRRKKKDLGPEQGSNG